MATATKRPVGEPTKAQTILPPRMRALYIASQDRTGGWLAEAFAADSASQVMLEEAQGAPAGLARLRDEVFDAILITHVPGELDALALIEGYRAGGADEPVIVLGEQTEQEMAALCLEVGADAYLCVSTTTTRNLIWVVARAVQRHQLIRENRRLNLAERQRLEREHDEARRLLVQQWALVADCDAPHEQPARLPAPLVEHYRELLRAFVIMGSGTLSGEMARLAELLAAAGITPKQSMQLHLHVLEDLVHGLGARSSRHVMTRADLLILEIMLHLGERYRQRYQERLHPPRQQMLPGFDTPAAAAFGG
jgi:DNA-binding response OmpR family regulator